jgi:NADPH:quinone reductase-like Zn-dependent oxidoreductase
VQAIVIKNAQAVLEEVRDPSPAQGEVKIQVASSGLNAADLAQIAGKYPPPPGFPPDRLGMEFAGTIVETGPLTSEELLGKQVMGITGGGAMAQFLCVPHDALVPVPGNIDPLIAGAFPEAAFTALDALFWQGNLQLGDRVLVTGALGGVGTAVLQLASLAGARVTALVRNEDRFDEAYTFGAERAITPDQLAGSGPYELAIELVSASNIAQTVRELSTGGSIVVVGVGAGSNVEIDARWFMTKRARLSAATLRPRPWGEKAQLAKDVSLRILPHLESGAYRIPISASFPANRIGEALERFRQPGKLGKLVITWQ